MPVRVGDTVLVEVEIPRGGHLKRSRDGRIEAISPLPAPFNYGSVVGVEAEDGDLLDAVVLGRRRPVGWRGELRVIGSKDPAGFELCAATQATCRFVRADLRARGEVLLTDADAASATRVRFCWADSPLCNLFDTTGLPVGPFEIEVK